MSDIENEPHQEDEDYEKNLLYPTSLNIRITHEMRDELEKIAAYEETKPSTFARRELLSTVRRYQRNPQYKRWLKRIDQVWKKET